MKIKRERQVRFDELLKHVWDNDVASAKFIGRGNYDIYVDIEGEIDVDAISYIAESDLFTITEEVEIEYDTRLNLIAVKKGGTVSRFENRSIQGVLALFNMQLEVEVDYIYLQNPDGSIGELIWSKERGLVD